MISVAPLSGFISLTRHTLYRESLYERDYMKTISIKSPNLEYYLAVERCDKALHEFLLAYIKLSKVDKPAFCYHEDDLYPFSKCMEDHLDAYTKALEE